MGFVIAFCTYRPYACPLGPRSLSPTDGAIFVAIVRWGDVSIAQRLDDGMPNNILILPVARTVLSLPKGGREMEGWV